MTTIDGLLEQAKNFDAAKSDTIFNAGEARAFGRQIAVGGMAPMNFSPLALTQLADKVGYHTTEKKVRMPIDWLANHADNEEFEFNFNYRFNKLAQKGVRKFMARAYNGNGSDKPYVRAIVGAEYPTFGNGEVFENQLMIQALADTLKGMTGNVAFARCELTPDRVGIRAFVNSFDPAQLGSKDTTMWAIGWALKNSETGDGGFSVRPAIKRTSCNNSIVIQHEMGSGANYGHVGGKQKFINAIATAMLDVVPAAQLALQRFANAEQIGVAIKDEIALLSSHFGWTDKKGNVRPGFQEMRDAVLVGTEGQATLAGLVNGVTYAAHSVEQSDEGQLAMELFAGALLQRVR